MIKSIYHMEKFDKITEDNKKISHKGHRARLRALIENTDIAQVPEIQLMELILSYVQPQKDVNPIAHKLLDEFGCIANVFDTSPEYLMKVDGVGEVMASFLNFCSKIPEIYKLSKRNHSKKLNTAMDIVEFLKSTIDFSANEKFYYLCLNAKGDVLCFKNMGIGSVSQIYINNRELVQQILKYPTISVVICHTHPQGIPRPSHEDMVFTKKFCELLDSIQIKLCDHIILSPDGYYSFFQQRMLGGEMKTEKFGTLGSTILSQELFAYDIDEIEKKGL